MLTNAEHCYKNLKTSLFLVQFYYREENPLTLILNSFKRTPTASVESAGLMGNAIVSCVSRIMMGMVFLSNPPVDCQVRTVFHGKKKKNNNSY